MLKAAFFDVDGTLLSSGSGEIPGSAVDALARMRERGVKLFLATGRHKLELTDMLQRYPLHFDGFLTLNSGYCYFADGAVFYKNPLHPGDVAAAVEYLKGPGRSLAVMFREEEARYYSCVSEYVQRIDPENFRQVRVGDIGRAVSHDVFQMCPYGTDEEVAGLLSVMPHSKATRWNSYGMDVVPQSGGKRSSSVSIEQRDASSPLYSVGNITKPLTNSGVSSSPSHSTAKSMTLIVGRLRNMPTTG